MILICLVIALNRMLWLHRLALALLLSTPFSLDHELDTARQIEGQTIKYYRLDHPVSIVVQCLAWLPVFLALVFAFARPNIKKATRSLRESNAEPDSMK